MTVRALWIVALAFALAGCGDNPPPKPPVKPQAQPVPAAPAAQAEPKPVAAPAPAPAPDPNKELAARVKHALESEAKIQAAGIDVSALDGKVTLWGTATNAAERSRAARVAIKVAGVKSVENKISVVKGS